MKLVLSKIDDIAIIQYGESNLTVSNKNELAGKVGGYGTDGYNESIDLGKGTKKHTITVYTTNRSNARLLHNKLYYQRYVKITDKFKGVINAYIDTFDMTDSDEHIGVTLFKITFTEQDEVVGFLPNFGAKLLNFVSVLDKEIFTLTSEILGTVSTLEHSYVKGQLFLDTHLNFFNSGLNKILNVIKINDNPLYGNVTKAKLKDMFVINLSGGDPYKTHDTIKELINFRPITNPTETKTTRGETNVDTLNTAVSLNNFGVVAEVIPPFNAKLNDNDVPVSYEYNGVDKDSLDLYKKIAINLNLIAVSRGIKTTVGSKFSDNDDFKSHINSVIEKLNRINKPSYVTSETIYNIRAFANTQNYRNIITHHVNTPQPLVRVVQDLYGHIDDYLSIVLLNGLADNDSVVGDIKLFTAKVKG